MKKCPKCNEMIDDDSSFCPHCSYEIPKKNSNNNTKNNNNLIIVAIVAVVAIVAIALAAGMFSSNDNSVSVDDSDNDSQVTEVEPIQDNDSTSDSVFWASEKSDKFHKPDCEWAEKISEANKIVYNSRDDALDDGKVPCNVCNP